MGLFPRQFWGGLMAEPSGASPLHAEALLSKCPFVAILPWKVLFFSLKEKIPALCQFHGGGSRSSPRDNCPMVKDLCLLVQTPRITRFLLLLCPCCSLGAHQGRMGAGLWVSPAQ